MRMLPAMFLSVIVSLAPLTPALAQSNSDQALRAGLLDLKSSGPEGSLKVAKMFAECHGFRSALYDDLTKDVILRLDDSDFALFIGSQAMNDGHMAFLSSVAYTQDAKSYVNGISQTERDYWSGLIKRPGKKDPLIWEKLSLCDKIAPMSQYFVEEIRKSK